MQSLNVRARLLQIVDELKAEGYRVTGTLGDSVFALKHTNGNRMTITAVGKQIGYIKNGHLVKTEKY